MIRKVSLMVTGALMGATAMSLLHVVPGIQAEAAGSDTYKQLSIFGDVFERVRSTYVTVPEEKDLIKNAINGMLTSLDPHSSYMDEKDAADMQVQTKGKFGGLGIEVTMENELVKVITPIDDTPAAKAGIRSGDLIAKIDGTEVTGMSLEEAVDKMRGEVNEPIKLTILRKGADKPIDFTIIRDVIKVKAVKYRVENDVGYMKITSFTEQAFGDLDEAIKKIEAEVPAGKLKGFILDLRNNPGGLLDQAVSVSDTFLDKGEVVSTRGRDPQNITRYDSEKGDSDRWQAADRHGQWRFRQRVGNCRRGFAGSQARNRSWHQVVRQGLGPDHHPARRNQGRASSDDRALLHAGRQVDPGQGHHSGHRDRTAAAGRIQGCRHKGSRIPAERPYQGQSGG